MKTWEKWTTWIGTTIAVLPGIWGAYTGHEAMKLKQPLDEHIEMVKSYQGQIDSARSRKDSTDVIRLRIEYENYEEQWRTFQRVTAIVAPLAELRVSKLTPAATNSLSDLMSKLLNAPAVTKSQPVTMGAAYLALDRFDSAAWEFSSAAAGPKTLALKAAAYGGLAGSTTDAERKQQYRETAQRSLEKSIKASYGTPEGLAVIRFAQDTAYLAEILPEAMGQKGDGAQTKQ